MSTNNNQVESRLWGAADELRANSKLKASEYSIPVLGMIFLRYADVKFAQAEKQVGEQGGGRRRSAGGKERYQALGVLYLPEAARFGNLLQLPEGANIGQAINDAMRAIEAENSDLKDVLPKTYNRLENATLVELLKLMGSIPMDIEGDAFGMPRTDNANYLWIQHFYSALGPEGRAGFVMANSASDARASELLIRQQLIEAKAVDVMVAVGSNFFYTVTLPDCQNGTVDLTDCRYLPESAYSKYQKHELREGDLVVATVGSHPTQPGSVVGRPIVIPKGAAGALLNQNAVCIRPTEEEVLDRRFLSHFAKAPPFGEYIIACARGSANQVRMAIGLLKNMPIGLPDVTEQKEIAAILSAYEDLIENNLRRIKILEEMAQNLYREWFVKFRFPGHEQVRMVDSPLGKIPAEWDVVPFGGLLEHTIGGGWGKEEPDERHSLPAHVIRGTDIPGAKKGQIDSVPFRYHTPSNLKSRRLCTGDIVFEVSGGSKDQPVGRALLVNDTVLRAMGGDTMCASFCKLVRPRKEVVSSFQLFIHIEDIYEDRRIMEYQTQSTGISNLKFSVFSERELVPVPVTEVRVAFDRHMDTVFRQMANLGERNRNLRQTRDLLLPKLISGELDVSELNIATDQEAA